MNNTYLNITEILKKKKSTGCDGITQAQLTAGSDTLTKPIVKIFNKSIKEGVFPNAWKEAIIKSLEANQLKEAHGGKILTSTYINDAAKLWNIAPDNIKHSDSIYSAKKNIKNFIRGLPI